MTCTLMKIARKNHNFSRKDSNHPRTRYTKDTEYFDFFDRFYFRHKFLKWEERGKRKEKERAITRYDIKRLSKKQIAIENIPLPSSPLNGRANSVLALKLELKKLI